MSDKKDKCVSSNNEQRSVSMGGKKEYSRMWMPVKKAVKIVIGENPTDVCLFNWINMGVYGLKLPVIRTGGEKYRIYRISPRSVSEWLDKVEERAREEAATRQTLDYEEKYHGDRKVSMARQEKAERLAMEAVEKQRKEREEWLNQEADRRAREAIERLKKL